MITTTYAIELILLLSSGISYFLYKKARLGLVLFAMAFAVQAVKNLLAQDDVAILVLNGLVAAAFAYRAATLHTPSR